ncbi:MAG: hypothetical protein ACE5D6_03515, partial [Candidatus Zixiibacteriota bacterium]
PDSIITYPHFPQIGQAGWHGPFDNRIYFDLRLPQLKKEFLMLYLEWLERERLGLEPQIWAWGWANHGGSSTELHAAEIQEILSWLNENFIDSLSPRGNIIAQFASDHELKGIYENYESSGGQPLPSPLDSINDQFPYMDTALTDCGVTTDLSSSLGLSGIRLFEMEINPPEDPQPEPLSKVYLLFRETDGIDTIDISAVLALQDISDTTMILTDVKTFATSQVSSTNLILGPTPLVLTPAVQQVSSEDSPFGFHPAIVTLPGYPDNGFIDALNIGIKWARQGVYAFWFIVQPDINNPVYDFSLYDQQWSAIPDEINILANISPQGHLDEGYCLPGTWIPIDSTKYCDFVKATVERYDGDSLSDMPGLTNPIKYWQVGNEPNENITSDFATLQRMTYIAIKEACPDCRVLIGGVAGFPLGYVQSFDSDYMPILTELAGQYVDIMDIHWYGTATGEYREVEVAYNHIRDTMNILGFSPDLPFWITEMGAYSGDPANAGPLVFPYQSEQQQGADYLKRHVHSLSIGVGKIFCAFGLSEGFKLDNGYFDHTGLIYDGLGSNDLGLGKKKLGYFSYKKMTAILEGCDWDSTQSISTGVENVYAYRFVRNDSSIYAAWWDYFDDPNYITGDSIQLTLQNLNWDSALVTEAIPYDTFDNAFNVNTVEIISGSITVTLKENPLFIEASSTGESCCVGIRGNIDGDPYDEINIADLVFLVDFMFNYGNPPPCPEEADVNGDNEQDIADLVYLVDYSFSNPPGPQPVDCL